MMEFAREDLTPDFQEEIGPLIAAHWREIAHYQDIPLEPDWPAYFAAQASGALRVFTLRDAEAPPGASLAGYGVYFVRNNIHYRSSLQAVQDILFLKPTYRGRLVGLRFIKWCDAQLASEGVQAVYQHVKAEHDFGPLLARVGYELVDLIYARRLDKGDGPWV